MNINPSTQFWLAIVFSVISGGILAAAALYSAGWAIIAGIQAMRRRPMSPVEQPESQSHGRQAR